MSDKKVMAKGKVKVNVSVGNKKVRKPVKADGRGGSFPVRVIIKSRNEKNK